MFGSVHKVDHVVDINGLVTACKHSRKVLWEAKQPRGSMPVKKKAKTGPKGPIKYNEYVLEREAEALIEWCKKGDDIYLGNFALKRGYHRKRFPDFAKTSQVFADALEIAMQWQEAKCIQNALTRKWDSAFTSRIMARICGPEWKTSWDKEDEVADRVINVTVNKIKG